MNKSKTYFQKWVKMLQFQDCDIKILNLKNAFSKSKHNRVHPSGNGSFLTSIVSWTHFPPSRKYPPILLMAPPLASLSISCDLWALIIIAFEGMKSRIFSFLPPCCCSIINLCPNYWQHLCFTLRKAIDHKKKTHSLFVHFIGWNIF